MPMHEVVIDVLTGASGGGMCAAITALALSKKEPYEAGKDSLLYKTWVTLFENGTNSFERMLDATDLKNKKSVLSLLNSEFIDEIAFRIFDDHKQDDFRKPDDTGNPWFSKQTELVLTASNLRGIPYTIRFEGSGVQHHHYMLNHKLLLKFTTDEQKILTDKSFIPLRFHLFEEDRKKFDYSNAQFLKESSKATGAFPLGLRPRRLTVPREYINNISFSISTLQKAKSIEDEQLQFICRKPEQKNISPEWPDNNTDYQFTAVDGGLTNNEPFEITRELLLNKGEKRNSMPRNADEVDRTIIMIDPFPNNSNFIAEEDYKQPENLMDVFVRIFKTLRNQPLFKMEDIQLAEEDNVYSRYLIVPKREDNDEFRTHPIASAVLNGFGGFFDRSFREHDYRLGRRNCQRFLRFHFGLPVSELENNPVFAGKWTKEAIERFAYDRLDDGKTVSFVPFIPDTRMENIKKSTVTEEQQPVYPKFDARLLKKYRGKIWKRAWLVIYTMVQDKFVINKANFFKPLALYIIMLPVVLLLLPFLLILGLPLYFAARQTFTNYILHGIEKDFMHFKLIRD